MMSYIHLKLVIQLLNTKLEPTLNCVEPFVNQGVVQERLRLFVLGSLALFLFQGLAFRFRV